MLTGDWGRTDAERRIVCGKAGAKVDKLPRKLGYDMWKTVWRM